MDDKPLVKLAGKILENPKDIDFYELLGLEEWYEKNSRRIYVPSLHH